MRPLRLGQQLALATGALVLVVGALVTGTALVTGQLSEAHPVLVQLPYFDPGGAFVGVIDLIRGRLRVWDDASLGMVFHDQAIPARASADAIAARERMVEAIAESDEALLEGYVSGNAIDDATLIAALRRATIARKLVPVLVGAAYRNKGVHDLLDAVVDYLPSPSDMTAAVGHDPATGKTIERAPTADAPLAALAFKIMPEASGQLVYFRVYSGRLRAGESVLNATKGKLEQVGRLVRMHANHREEVEELMKGGSARVSR